MLRKGQVIILKAIVAVDQNWGIGYKGQLLTRIPADMKHFRDTTMSHPILYGRKTLETFPHQKPLPGRTNYVLSRNLSLHVPGAIVLHSISEALQVCPDDAFVIGGAEIYGLMLSYCSIVYVTKIKSSFPADAWFENMDKAITWSLAEEGETGEFEGLQYQFLTYKHEKG